MPVCTRTQTRTCTFIHAYTRTCTCTCTHTPPISVYDFPYPCPYPFSYLYLYPCPYPSSLRPQLQGMAPDDDTQYCRAWPRMRMTASSPWPASWRTMGRPCPPRRHGGSGLGLGLGLVHPSWSLCSVATRLGTDNPDLILPKPDPESDPQPEPESRPKPEPAPHRPHNR